MDITAFILGGSAFAALIVAVIKWVIKKITKVEYETLGSLVILFIVSSALAGIAYGFNYLSPEVQTAIGAIFALTVTIYDVLKKAVWDGLITKYLQ